ncbi:unnamed protein product [Prorocentrum cordatum]|nr:unnamed protein product [Polarella glacialis]
MEPGSATTCTRRARRFTSRLRKPWFCTLRIFASSHKPAFLLQYSTRPPSAKLATVPAHGWEVGSSLGMRCSLESRSRGPNSRVRLCSSQRSLTHWQETLPLVRSRLRRSAVSQPLCRVRQEASSQERSSS